MKSYELRLVVDGVLSHEDRLALRREMLSAAAGVLADLRHGDSGDVDLSFMPDRI